MHPMILASFFQSDRVVLAMFGFGLAILAIGAWRIKDDLAQAQGLDKIAVLCTVCYAVPLGMFGALHLFGVRFVVDLVPKYMPGRLFWAYFVGCALLATSLSMATRIAVRWSGVLIGILMFMFVVMLYILRGVMIQPHNRIVWTIAFRETSFGAAGWILAGNAMRGWRAEGKGALVIVGRTLLCFTAIMFGIEHFLHPLGLPGVPLEREMPMWVPARVLIDYLTGAGLVATGACLLLNYKARLAATLLGGWLLLMILAIYVPVMISGLASLNLPMQVEGLNYFADTLFFTGAILAAAYASPHDARPGDRAR